MGEEIFGINDFLVEFDYNKYKYSSDDKYYCPYDYNNISIEFNKVADVLYGSDWVNDIKSTLLDVIKDIDPSGEFISFKVMYYLGTFDCEVYNREIEESKLIFTVNKEKEEEKTVGKYQEIFRTNILKWVLSNKFNEESVTRVK